ncbi:MAG: DUF3445 domain-containing protein [Armatimonadetes bacterium]|nr:DUF3445 domain-containing protein [Armatimonadota bacterium]
MTLPDLPEPAVYFPLHKARYTVTPSLSLITISFGNGATDARLFQIDRDFPRFRENKIAARQERLTKYALTDWRFDALAPDVCRLIAVRLAVEYPAYFALEMLTGGAGVLTCHLTGERLSFDREMWLLSVEGANAPPYENTFDALISQTPEDMAVVSLPEGEPDAIAALHVCSPSHWSPESVIGQPFTAIHAPVPGMGKISAASASLLEAIRTLPPVVRFNWGIEFADRLNLHPEPPPGTNADRRILDAAAPCPLFLRVERQVLWGMETARALLFAIRVYTRPVTELSPRERDDLREALLTMPEASRLYKGLPPETFAAVMDYLSGGATG